MYSFVPQITFFLSLAVIIYLFARAMPRVKDYPAHTAAERSIGRLSRFLKAIPTEKLDQWFGILLEKFLRKTKVVVLKIDNRVTIFLEKIRTIQKRETGDGKQAAMESMLKDLGSLKDTDEDQGT